MAKKKSTQQKQAETRESQLNKTVRFNHYDFSFEMVLDEPEAREIFKLFCDEVLHTGESLNFLANVEKFKMLRHVKSRHKLCKTIVNDYVRIGSLQEINISAEVRARIVQTYDKFEEASKEAKSKKGSPLTLVPLDIFDESFMIMISELKQEVFPRFTRSTHLRRFVKVIERTDPEMLNRIAQISKPSGKSMYNIYPSDEKDRQITDNDIETLEALALDLPHKWKVIRDHEQFQVFSSVARYSMHDSRIENNLMDQCDDSDDEEEEKEEVQDSKNLLGQTVYRISGIVNYSVKNVLDTLANPEFKAFIDGALSKSYQIDYLTKPETNKDSTYCTSVTLDAIPLPWPIACRDFITANSMVKKVFEDQEKYYIIKKSYNHKSSPARTGTVRGEIFNGWILQKLKDNVTRYTFLEWSDMKFNDLTGRYYSKVAKRRFAVLHECLVEALQENSKNSFPLPEFTYGLLETLAGCTDEQKVQQLRKVSDSEETTPTIKRIAYLSKYTKPLNGEELEAIGTVAVKNNQPRNITGMLLCAGGIFYQVVEGLPEHVDFIYAKIIQDSRHCDIQLVSEEFGLKDSDRQFPNWSMNTVNLDLCDDFYSVFMKNMIRLISNFKSGADSNREQLEQELIGNASQLLKQDHLSSKATMTIAATYRRKHKNAACHIL